MYGVALMVGLVSNCAHCDVGKYDSDGKKYSAAIATPCSAYSAQSNSSGTSTIDLSCSVCDARHYAVGATKCAVSCPPGLKNFYDPQQVYAKLMVTCSVDTHIYTCKNTGGSHTLC